MIGSRLIVRFKEEERNLSDASLKRHLEHVKELKKKKKILKGAKVLASDMHASIVEIDDFLLPVRAAEYALRSFLLLFLALRSRNWVRRVSLWTLP